MKVKDLHGVMGGRVIVFDYDTLEAIADVSSFDLLYLQHRDIWEADIEHIYADMDRNYIRKYADALYGFSGVYTAIEVTKQA